MELVEALVSHLRVAETRRVTSNNDRLVTMNQEAINNPAPGFIYRGRVFRHSSHPRGKFTFPGLDSSLYREGDALIDSQERVEGDLQFIRQSLIALVRPCKTQEDLRDALPECLIQITGNQLTHFPRTREEAWTLEPGSRPHRQYLKILPKIEFFAAARLIY